ncbi:MAG: phosphoadenylyl-sulfate reductase [Xanthobacteraceae bacterium]
MIVVDTLRDVTAALDHRLSHASPHEIAREAIRSVPPKRIAVASSFGIESAALLCLIADIDRDVPILFLDTGWLFPETLAYRDTLVERLGLRDVRVIEPAAQTVANVDPAGDLWARDPVACCNLRKVEPLASALAGFAAWINGRKRYHGGARANIPAVELDGERLKFNPLARARREEIDALFERTGLPRHPLQEAGFASVGCAPCTSRLRPGEPMRAGRWRGRAKTECGIHALVQGG